MPRRKRSFSDRLRKKFSQRIKNPIFLLLFGIFVLAFLYLFWLGVQYLIFRNEAYPNVTVGKVDIGGLGQEDAENILNERLKGVRLEFVYKEVKKEVAGEELGLVVDSKKLKDIIDKRNKRPWFMPYESNIPILYDEAKVTHALSEFEVGNTKEAKNATFRYKDGGVDIIEGENGMGIDKRLVMGQARYPISIGEESSTSEIQLVEFRPDVVADDIRLIVNDLVKKLDLIVIVNGTEVSKEEKSNWLEVLRDQDNQTYISVKKEQVVAYVSKLSAKTEKKPVSEITEVYTSGSPNKVVQTGKDGLKIENSAEVAGEVYSAFSRGEGIEVDFRTSVVEFSKEEKLVDDAVKVTASYTYDVVRWGNTTSDFDTFKSNAMETLADRRGWISGGAKFTQVASGGDFTLVLATPDQVAGASSGCSAEWSCRVGRYVIINDSRWSGATTAWNQAGGNLRDYRHMVINHEIGHYLGFGHRFCSAAGALAPIMQQQSIDLQGCKFNPWPTQSELDSV